jgi:Raf kinase inhibitor-like YbhB/YbcL family protein
VVYKPYNFQVGIRFDDLQKEGEAYMKITSNAFEHEGFIPRKYTCEGEDISPQLDIAQIPEGTESLALIVDDPDAPMGTWVHWVVYDIPVTERIAENRVPGMQGTKVKGQ